MSLETELRKALEPVMHWYQSDEEPNRDLVDIVKDAVADLQLDRASVLSARMLMGALEHWLETRTISPAK